MNEIKKISIENEEYPKLLKQIYDPPKTLYIMGNEKLLNSLCIAIVGCRDVTEYGKKAATYFSYNLAKNDITIVSGLAKGVDSFSHIGALEAKGKTIAVIGSGLDIIYPKENLNLVNRIIKQDGAIISEYPLGTKPDRWHFPARNRIISGLSKAVLVVEAKEKSGSLITADFAIEQGREVFAIPGNINSLNSMGTNKLIKDGAMPVLNFNDILSSVEFCQ